MKYRWAVLVAVTALLVAITFLIPRIPQSEAYHNFADQRTMLGVPNCLNVISNVLFLFVGALGIAHILGSTSKFTDSRERWPWLVFFASVALTAFGSAYYHINPNDRTLVWDRLPMAVGFMALLAAVLAERVNVGVGLWLLTPLALCGAASVFCWALTQARGNGDLRPYALVQFGSFAVLLLIVALYPPRYTRGYDLIISFAIYGIAKIFEAADRIVYSFGHVVSGHTLKHVAAALSAWWILRMLQLRHPLEIFSAQRAEL